MKQEAAKEDFEIEVCDGQSPKGPIARAVTDDLRELGVWQAADS